MHAAFRVSPIRALIFALGFVLQTAAHAHPVLKCRMQQGDRTFVYETVPSHDPYSYVPFDVRNRFRINAVVVGDSQQVDYVKIYAYYYRRGLPYPAHIAHYPSPAVQSGEDQAPLTGLQRVYAPPKGFELQYSCVLFERPAESAK